MIKTDWLKESTETCLDWSLAGIGTAYKKPKVVKEKPELTRRQLQKKAANKRKYDIRVRSGARKLYRWFMEEMLGRPLRSDEDVHHKNFDCTDDRPENLEVMPHKDNFALHHKHNARRQNKKTLAK